MKWSFVCEIQHFKNILIWKKHMEPILAMGQVQLRFQVNLTVKGEKQSQYTWYMYNLYTITLSFGCV